MLEPQQRREDFKLDLPNFYTDDDLTDLETAPHAKTPWWRQRRGIVAISAGLAVILIAGVVTTALANRKAPVTYTTQAVQQGDLAITVSATGPINGNLYNVNFSGNGKIAEIDVKVGQQVTAGQVLAKMDPTSLQDAVNQAQAQVNAAQISLNNAISARTNTFNQTKATLATAYDQEQAAIHTCNTEPTPPPNCVQQAEDQYQSAQTQAASQNASAQSQVNSAQAQLNSAKTSLTTAQHNLSTGTITAPAAGTVAAVNGIVGGTPGTGSSSSSGSGGSSPSGSSAFIQIVDLSSLQVAAGVNEADIGGVTTGQPASFTVSAYAGRVFRGTVGAISPIGQTTSNVVTYPVTINVDMQTVQGANLLPGMTATITITTAQRIGVLLIPASAVTFARAAAIPANGGFLTRTQVTSALQQARQMMAQLQSDGTNGGTGGSSIANDHPAPAFVLERANGKWVVKPIVVGLTNGTVYEVLAGLNAGETIVTAEQGGTLTTSTSTGAGGGFGGGGRGGFGGGGFGGGGGGAGGGGRGGGTGG